MTTNAAGGAAQPEMVIRRATGADARALAELAERTFRDTFATDNRPEDVEQYVRSAFGETIQAAELADPDVETLLLEIDGTLAAYAQLRSAAPPPEAGVRDGVELRRFYVDRRWHGRGLAQRLMAEVEEATLARGTTALWLGVWERNPRAIAFYRACGFLDVGSQVFVLGEDPQTDRIMARRLASGSRTPHAPERLYTTRLELRRPRPEDAGAIFARYAGDAEVTRLVGWPKHRTLDDTRVFLGFSDAEWSRWPAGPYLVVDREGGALLGSTGLGFESPTVAATGYVFARDAWGRGYATEALAAIVAVARATGVERLYALCHTEHRTSARVLEKGGFVLEARLPNHAEFPNLTAGVKRDVLCYVRLFQPRT